MELQARKATLSMVSAIVQRVSDLLSLARDKAEDILGTDILGNAPIITTLMPLCIADISYLAFTDPRVCSTLLNLYILKWIIYCCEHHFNLSFLTF